MHSSARDLDRRDPAPARSEFAIPKGVAYLAGNSLGLQCLAAKREIDQVLAQWAELGVVGHHEGEHPWIEYHDRVVGPLGRLVGARPDEVVAMNTLTVNIHLLLSSFYRPTPSRNRIVVTDPGFPSDAYAIASHGALRGFPDCLLRVAGADLPGALARPDVALALPEAVNYLTGELLDIASITEHARRHGVAIGWDLAHAAGNVELALHEWDVDFAVWCSYKYLNAGPGSMAAAFVHHRYAYDPDVPRLAGWWSNRADTRFEMRPAVDLQLGASGWQVSNPSILALAPFVGSLSLFDRVGMPALRARSLRLTGQLIDWLRPLEHEGKLTIVTPTEPHRRGAQVSVRVPDAKTLAQRLRDERGVIVDDRGPHIVRLAPAPLYNSYEDAQRAVTALEALLS